MNNLVAATTSVNVDRPLTINEGRHARIERARTEMDQSRLWLWTHGPGSGPWPFRKLAEQLATLPDLDLFVLDGYHLAAYD